MWGGDTHCTSAGIGGFMVLVKIKVYLSKADTRCNVGKPPSVKSSKACCQLSHPFMSKASVKDIVNEGSCWESI